MKKRKFILPLVPIGKIIQEATGKRVGKEAKETAEKLLEELTYKIVYKAKLLAENNKRKTIRDKDIILAYQQLKIN